MGNVTIIWLESLAVISVLVTIKNALPAVKHTQSTYCPEVNTVLKDCLLKIETPMGTDESRERNVTVDSLV